MLPRLLRPLRLILSGRRTAPRRILPLDPHEAALLDQLRQARQQREQAAPRGPEAEP